MTFLKNKNSLLHCPTCIKPLVNEITQAEFHSIICNEASDISKTGELFSVHYYGDDYDIEEDFIGIVTCEN